MTYESMWSVSILCAKFFVTSATRSSTADIGCNSTIENTMQSYFNINFLFLSAYDIEIKSKMREGKDNGGYKVWQCTDCPYSNKKTSHLYRHIERKHFSVSLSCEFCSQTFNCKETLATHKKKHLLGNSGF